MVEIAFGRNVGGPFKAKVIEVCAHLACDPSHLMACMAFETGGRFSSSTVNKVSGATGLIQFMPTTAKRLGTSTAALAAMTEVAQLDFVHAYFRPYVGRLGGLSDLYMAILWPKAVGRPDSTVLFASPETAYKQNAGLDANKDGTVTKGEAVAKVQVQLNRGLSNLLRG